MPDTPKKDIKFTYKNHRGVVSERTVTPFWVRYTKTGWTGDHMTSAMWVLKAWCNDRGAIRYFKLKDISNWREE